MKAITKEWLDFAETDLAACEKLLHDEHLTNIVLYHAQQVIEKCFKAILEENDLKVPRIHNLVHLYNRINNISIFKVDESMLDRLDQIYTESRYPGDLGMLPDGKPGADETRTYYELASEIFNQTSEFLSHT